MALEIPSWVNVDFAQRILRLTKDDNTIEVVDVFGKPAVSKGDNYASDMIRVTVEFIRKQGEKKVNEKMQLIFKFEPLKNDARQETMMKANLFDTEIAMMTDTLKKMSAILESRLSARVFYVRMEHPICLIMEDLATQGFRLAERTSGLDLAHCKLTIQQLAKFHATSVALCEKEPKYKSLYNKGLYSDHQPEEFAQCFTTGAKGFASEVEKWPELGKRYADKIGNLVPVIFQKCIEASRRNDNEFNVINHGDCWVNNMMFRYDENSAPIDHIFVDFQISVYTSPAVDLHYFLGSSSNGEVRFNHMEDLYEEYLRTLTTTMKEIGCTTLPPSMEELKKSLREREIIALTMSICGLPIIMLDKSKALDFEDILHGKNENPGLKNPAFRRIIAKQLQRYDEIGLLDP